MTDDDVRRRLDSLLADVPGGPLEPPADLTARAVRRSRRRRALASGAAVLGVVAVVGGTVVVGRDDDGAEDSLAVSEPVAVISPADLSGRRWVLPGDPVGSAFVAFTEEGAFRGADNCNSFGGRYELGPEGRFSARTDPEATSAGPGPCVASLLTFTSWFDADGRVALSDGDLVFFADDGQELGELTPAVVVYDPKTAPPPFVDRDPLPSCGSFVLDQGQAPSSTALSCLKVALVDGSGAELALSQPTIEGDAVVTYYRALPGSSTLRVFTDSTTDVFGARSWSVTTCTGFDTERIAPTGCAPTGYYPRPTYVVD